ncbi:MULTISPECIES: pilus assembly PilX family protein [Pseudomonas]|uniref:PilX N-terminal n=1 Tax=Pseudomonas segetis TaxID=298908 RepID=A0A239D5Y5_9PSED|nr:MULTISPECIES: PilX N-terminal domain-containing pilus assembly protein [Pseudomonas]SNS26993.1 PilX N-terminal [Pseudomonas segetis]
MKITQHSLEQQQGATLLVALIFLVVLTVAGITAARFATNEERMASSNQFRNTAFQLAQTEIRSQMAFFGNQANRGQLQTAIDLTKANAAAEPNATLRQRFPDLRVFTNLTALTTAPGLTQANQLRSMGKLDCAAYGEGYSFDAYTCQQYELKARSTIADSAYSDQTQGFVFFNLK